MRDQMGRQILRITAVHQSYHLHTRGSGVRQAKAKIFAQPGWKWAARKIVCLLNEPRAPLYTDNSSKLQNKNPGIAALSVKFATEVYLRKLADAKITGNLING
jgi:hypothetical protein